MTHARKLTAPRVIGVLSIEVVLHHLTCRATRHVRSRGKQHRDEVTKVESDGLTQRLRNIVSSMSAATAAYVNKHVAIPGYPRSTNDDRIASTVESESHKQV